MTIGLVAMMYLLFILIPGLAAGVVGFGDVGKPTPYGKLAIPNAVVAVWGGICSFIVLFGVIRTSLAETGPVWWFCIVMGILSSVWLIGTLPQVQAFVSSLRGCGLTPSKAEPSINETT